MTTHDDCHAPAATFCSWCGLGRRKTTHDDTAADDAERGQVDREYAENVARALEQMAPEAMCRGSKFDHDVLLIAAKSMRHAVILAAENAELRATVARVEAVASAGWPHVGYSDLRAALRPPDSEADRG